MTNFGKIGEYYEDDETGEILEEAIFGIPEITPEIQRGIDAGILHVFPNRRRSATAIRLVSVHGSVTGKFVTFPSEWVQFQRWLKSQ